MKYDPDEDSAFRAALGGSFRPGGLTITGRALELCAFPAGARLVDLGCGAGVTLGFLKERGYQVLGVDRSAALLAEARRFGPVLEADFHHLPLPSDWAEGIFCECVLSLARRPGELLREAGRLLKPGGRLALSDLFRRDDSGTADARAGPAGVHSLEDLENLMAEAGFIIEHQVDFSRALPEAAARLVWHLGSAEVFRRFWRPKGGPGGGGRLGYVLIVAQKPNRRNGAPSWKNE